MRHYIRKLLGRRARSTSALPPGNKALWEIGIFSGTSPLTLGADGTIWNPVITRDDVTDVPVSFVADPFLIRTGNCWHMFFEVLNRRSRRGEIALAMSDDLARWTYQHIVLAEPFHLSYPLVFEWMGAFYMVPETHQTRTIRLYRARSFPGQWELVHTLISGHPFSDSTLFRHDERWWLFTETGEPGRNDTLRLYHACDLFDRWVEHPASPIVAGDVHTARPAGAVVHTPDGILRFAQVCAPRYGMSVNAFVVTELTTTTYAERPVEGNPILAGSSTTPWNDSRMHHVDAHCLAPGQWIAAVDGARNVTAAVIAGTEGAS